MFMRRLLAIAVALAALPAGAQMRGMGGMGRPAGGMARPAGIVAPAGGAPVRVGPHFAGTFQPRSTGGVIITTNPFLIPTNHGFVPFCVGCRHFHNGFFPFGSPFFGWGSFGYGGPAYWPAYSWDSGGYGYTADSGYAAQLQMELANQQNMTAQLEAELRAERLRQAEQQAMTPSAPKAAAQPAQTAKEQASPETVLVFRDGSRTEVQNYAIVGPTLYEFGPHWTKKVSLSDLDVPATVKTNNDRGVQFEIPAKVKGS